MGDKTHISWTTDDWGRPGATWNFVTGCERISDGCSFCYIDRTPPFRMAGRRFDGPQIGATTGVLLHPDRLERSRCAGAGRARSSSLVFRIFLSG